MTLVSKRLVSRRKRVAGLAVAAAGGMLLCAGIPEARAQFGGLFGEQPPRPPAGVPRQQPQSQPQQQGSPFPIPFGQPPTRRPVEPHQERLPPGPPPSARVAPQSDSVQSETLPPPGEAAPLPPGLKPQNAPAQPADTAPQPGDEVVTAPPAQKIPNGQAVFSGLDKITGRIISFDVAIGETVQFGALQVVPRVCYTRPPTEAAATDAFVEVSEVTLQGEVRRIFSGWMFAASPGLNAVEHPIYDVWLTDCKQPSVTVAESPGPGANVGADQPASGQPAAAAPAPQNVPAPAPRPQRQAQQPQGEAQQPQGEAPQQAAPPRPRPPRPPQQQQGSSQQQRAFPMPIR